MSALATGGRASTGTLRPDGFKGFLLLLGAGIVGALVFTAAAFWLRQSGAPSIPLPDLVEMGPGAVSYREAGEFLMEGIPVDPPIVSVALPKGVSIMRRLVSRAEYEACVIDRSCAALATGPGADARLVPATGLSWQDATAYAAWLSDETGVQFRLPTDAEWAYAAGEAFHDDSIGGGSSANPAERWLAAYDKAQAADAGLDPKPLPFASFGANSKGLVDVGGNVWEWTDTCYVRRSVAADGRTTRVESCGVRVVEGRHRTYLSDFIRNARGGACSAGAPPANLGVRLVRDRG
jgi:formylglycine-generating enzyme required for sulfatase activity